MNQQKLRILHILPTLNKGGGERVVIDLANFASRMGNFVEILVVENSSIQNVGVFDLISNNVKVSFALESNGDVQHSSTFWGTLKKFHKWFLFCIWILKNKQKIRSFKIIHVHMPIAVVGGNLIKFLNYIYKWDIKVFETVHSDTKSLKRSTFMLFKQSWKYRDGVIFEIRKEDIDIFKKFYPNIPVKFIPLGVYPISRKRHELNRCELRSELQIDDDTLVIGQIGRLNIQDRRTNMYPLLFKEIENTIGSYNKKIFYVLFGDGLDRSKIEAEIEKLGISKKVKIYGYVNDIPKALSVIDFYVTLNIREDCGIAGLQAVSYGIPTVAIQGDSTYELGETDWIPSSLNMCRLSQIISEKLSSQELLVKKQSFFFESNISAEFMASETLNFYS